MLTLLNFLVKTNLFGLLGMKPHIGHLYVDLNCDGTSQPRWLR